MKLQFDSSQNYQLEAVKAVIDIFDGQPIAKGAIDVNFAASDIGLAFTERGVANQLVLSHEQIFDNVQRVQNQFNERHAYSDSEGIQRQNAYIEVSERLEPTTLSDGTILTTLNFTVEMETGTGKTYTYLRTVYELNETFGFKKFVVVVPSVAIREGTVKNLEITHEHFQSLYGKPPINFVMYDSSRLANLRNFATSNAIQILVINIDSFTKDTNIINTVRESGVRPIEYIQSTNPILIVDEPQNMETDIRKSAINNLNPLFTLRYSATHKNVYNLVYSLNPVQAYDLGLVKQIEVDGITSDDNYNAAFVEFKSIQRGKRTLKAKLSFYVNTKRDVQRKDFAVSLGDDLFELSGGRDIYSDGYIVNSIDAENGLIEFSGGRIMRLGQTDGGLTDEIFKYQIERTIKWHFDKVRKLKNKGIKVLSLIFIDKVSNYREYNSLGEALGGKFSRWFAELFEIYSNKPQNKGLLPFSADEVHGGYFSTDKKGKLKDTRGDSQPDRETYNLIMKNKEQLLSGDEPLQFIFSHSALREGWDNPNIFQICTLNESKSEIRKRQEIGRGLRLPVDKSGKRVEDRALNILTVVANETYEEFSRGLQSEIENETGVRFENRIKNTRDKVKVKLQKELSRENYPLFFEIWDKIKLRTRYRVEFSTDDVIQKTVIRLADFGSFPKTRKPMLEARTVRVSFDVAGIDGNVTDLARREATDFHFPIPDVFGYIQTQVDVSRYTIFEILRRSERMNELLINPQMFLDNVIHALKQSLNELLVEGIKYERINGKEYEMQLFESEEIETYLSNLLKVTRPEKTLYNYIKHDSSFERDFARDAEADDRIKFFFKLPRGFRIQTPLGNYIPDWAVVFDNDNRIYFVVETKGTLNKQNLREVERLKIACGERHFAILDIPDLQYRLAVTNKDLY